MEATSTSLMPQISIPILKGVIEHVVFKANKVAMVWGPAGAGKTETADQVCTAVNAALCDVRLGQQDTIDMRGLPIHDRNPASPTFNQTVWMPPSMLPFVGNDQWPDDRPILLALDEITSGLPQVLGGAYQLINERRYGEFILKPNVRIIAMGNREQDRGIVNRLPLPLCNRMVHYELVIDVQAFCEYAMTQGIPRWLIAFWLFRNELVHTFDPNKPEKIFATPRTWFMFATFIQTDMPDDIRIPSCMGAVGRGPALEALGYRDIYEKVPSIKEIIAKPDTTAVPREASMEYAVCVKIAGSMNAKNAKPLYTYLKRMKPEFTVLGWTLAGKRDNSLMALDEFIDFGQRYREIFRAQQ